MTKRGLGRGLDALIARKPEPVAPATDAGLTDIPLALIDASPWQPRRNFDEEKLAALAESLREQGLVQPVVVRRKGGRYELVAGERRFRAAGRLGWETLRACVMDATDSRMRELALVENLQRDDLGPIETALAYQALQTDPGLTHEQIAKRLGISRAAVTNTLRLLDLPAAVRDLVDAGRLSAGHARAILALPDSLSQIRFAERIVAEELSVRAAEKAVAAPPRPEQPQKTETQRVPPQVADLENRLRRHLATKVTVRDDKGKGEIVIEYFSPDDMTRLLERMGVPGELAD